MPDGLKSILPTQPISLEDLNRIVAKRPVSSEQKKAAKVLGGSDIDPLEVPVNAIRGLLGLDPTSERGESGYGADAAAQLLTAAYPILKSGLPLSAIIGNKPLFHGAKSAFEEFNPNLYNKSDTLGWMTHFTESPETADQFAQGMWSAGGLNRFGTNPNIIAAKAEAKNVLDLSAKGKDINIDDFSQALAGLDPTSRASVIKKYRNNSKLYGTETALGDLKYDLRNALNNPEVFKRTPFDGIRYMDISDKPDFAFPESTPIISYYSSASLNKPGKPLQVIRGEGPYTGLTSLTPNFTVKGQ